MKRLAPYAWVAVLGTALALSWWSLDSLARHYGMPAVLAGMVSATFDGAALVAADLALRRAAKAHSTAAVKLLMIGTVGLSAWLNYQHGQLLGYPVAIRVLFAAPPVIAGWLFELQLGGVHQDRLDERGGTAPSIPRLGLLVWIFHPWAALRRTSQIAGSRLRSVPISVVDWSAGPVAVVVSEIVTMTPVSTPVLQPETGGTARLETTVGTEDTGTSAAAADGAAPGGGIAPAARGQGTGEPVGEVTGRPKPTGRKRVPDEVYLEKLRALVEEDGGVIPSVREAARRLSIGQDRAGRLVELLKTELNK